eukprot:scaffold139613_cov52-Prasinocladus_malaysianus.AAC.1
MDKYWPRDFVSIESLDKVWRDPSMAIPYQGLCNMLNHEFQKHGVCFENVPQQASPEQAAASYFQATLHAMQAVQQSVNMLNAWAAENFSPSMSEIRNLYPYTVQVLCSAGDHSQNYLSVIRSCYKANDANLTWPELIDCQEEAPYGPFRLCTDHQL